MLIVQDDASQGQAHSSDLAWIDITAHVCRILSLSIQFNWFAASAVDQAIRQKIEASESMGLGSLSDFYSKSDLVSEVILSALTAYSFSDHPSRFDKKRGRATGNDTVGPNRDSKKASPSKPNNGPERSGRDIGRGPLANTHL
ncbi:hypothetical protein FOL47_007214 [Perkinsus chesapeaki]|uniref:Uncharacterized protein n=1 Tax=Perkinsus chesapeaki TaxID=330153 RepID=A0A7J6LM67_PERCH|nr:hypothetical protein FOL47_007214 [Perkinsus chesapeaki]